MNDPIETEIVNTNQAMVVAQPQSVSLFRTDDPVEVVMKATAVANALRDVIEKKGLVSNIKGKQYPKCEAWTLCGTMLGVFPVLCWSRPVDDGWEARVEAKTRDGAIVGAAEAQCLHSERNWADRDDFALRSMAQTRATAKALRMPLGFIMTLSGFEPTPSEEMPHDEPPKATPRTPPTDKYGNSMKPIPPPQRVIPKRDTAIATEKHRERMIEVLAKAGIIFAAHTYLVRIGQLKEDESVAALPLEFVPTTKEQMDNLKQCIERSMPSDNDGGEPPTYKQGKHDNGPIPEPSSEDIEAAHQQELEAPESEDVDSPDAPWRSYPLPFKWDKGATPAGTLLGKLQTKSLFALWANYVVKDEFNGKKLTPAQIAKNQELRRMLDDCGRHYEFTKRD